MKLCTEPDEEAGETVILLLLVHLKSNYEMEKYWVLKKGGEDPILDIHTINILPMPTRTRSSLMI